MPWAVGALLLVRREAFTRVGGFDADQWMYAEDLDLCWRLAREGYATHYEPGAVVHHAESAATTVAFGEDKTARFMTATYRVLVRRRGKALALATALVNIAGAAARVVVGRHREDNRRWLAAHHRAATRAVFFSHA